MKGCAMSKIGLVLSNTPGYSETFFVSKIKGLVEAGNELVLFASKGKDLSWLPESVKVLEPYKVSTNKALQVVKTVCVVALTMLWAPKTTKKYIALEKADGSSMGAIIRGIYINAHILPYRLDWLHFGFAAVGIGHENAAKAIGAKAAVSFRGYDISNYPLKHPGCYKKLFSKLDKVHSISDSLYNKALALGLSSEIPYQKITPAIDSEKFCEKRQYRMKQPIRIVSVGRLTWQKGFEYALQALSELDVDFRYTIIGDGTDWERLKFAAYQLGILDKVSFAGKQSHGKIAAYLRESDIYLQPSVQEGFCNAVLESQASGLICIVSDAEGLPENVEDGKSGFVVPRRNPEALAEKIKQVISMPQEELQTISDYAVERVRKQFDIKDQIEQFIKFYA